jgi:putative FmdB family regulatory protein
VPIYVYRCADDGECGLRFEQLTSFDAAAPTCPGCGGATRKIPAGFSLGGQADAGLAKDSMPQTWRGVYNGNTEYVGRMRRQWENRQRLEAKYPEIAGDQRPILAHEGRYHDTPLRAGDPRPGAAAPGAASAVAGHGHGHGHGHTHGAGDSPATPAAPAAPATPAAKPATGGKHGSSTPAAGGSAGGSH